MSSTRLAWFHALAAVSLGVLGWDAFRPRPDFPDPSPVPANAAPPAAQPPPDAASAHSPRLAHLAADRDLRPGQRLTVRGRIVDLTPDRPAILSLEGPDGTMASVEVRDDGTHQAVFTLQHPTPALAPGAFSWSLRLDPASDPVVLGVRVADVERPRVLLLLDHPGTEGARLQRWLGESGSPCTTRTRVSTERYRIASSPGTPVDGDLLDASALASLDLVVAHHDALDRLSPDQQTRLDLAIRRDGIGLLVLVSSGRDRVAVNEGTQPATPTNAPVVRGPAPDPALAGKKAFAWSWLRSNAPSAAPPTGQRETRIQLPDGVSLDTPVSVLATELAVPPAGQVLARDSQGRPIVAWASRGRGRWAGSLVLDSWRWRQHGQGDDYARYWSALLSVLARPRIASTGAWSLAEASLPVFVDQPMSLVWSGATDTPPPAAEARAHGAPNEPAIPLNLARSATEPSEARAVFWPVHPGWHTIRALPDGPTIDVHVQPARALPGVRAQRENDAERRPAIQAATPTSPSPDSTPPPWSRPWTRLAAFLGFVFAVAALWSGSQPSWFLPTHPGSPCGNG